jgi:aspartyl-tRNA(Asn)/glutamyl-tRNA(Gln) amidotransferase subunit A
MKRSADNRERFCSAFDNSYLKALQLRQRLRSDFNKVLRAEHPLREAEHTTSPTRGVDCLLHLTAIQTAPKLDLATEDISSDARGYAQDLLTVPASLGGLPSVSIPSGIAKDGWPVGLSLTGQWGSESVLFDIGRLGIESFQANRDQPT